MLSLEYLGPLFPVYIGSQSLRSGGGPASAVSAGFCNGFRLRGAGSIHESRFMVEIRSQRTDANKSKDLNPGKATRKTYVIKSIGATDFWPQTSVQSDCQFYKPSLIIAGQTQVTQQSFAINFSGSSQGSIKLDSVGCPSLNMTSSKHAAASKTAGSGLL